MENTLQKTIETLYKDAENSIKKDVLTWVELKSNTLDEVIDSLYNVKCENADVSHLVHNYNISAWVWDNEEAIIEIINGLAGTDLHDLDDINWAQHNELSRVLHNWESGDDRMTWFVDDYYEHARENAREDNENWELMTEEEKEEAISEEIDYLVKLHEPLELTSSDKANLAWLTFEQTAWDLAEELEELKKVS